MKKDGLFALNTNDDNAIKIDENINSNQHYPKQDDRNFHVSSFRLVNFKAFEDTGWIKINRITLLLGENSTGKSSLFQALQLLRFCYDKLKQEDLFCELSNLSEQFGEYTDMCNQNTHTKEIEFQFTLEDISSEKWEYKICIGPNANNLGIIKDVILKDEQGEHHLLSEGYQTRNIFFLEKIEDNITDYLIEVNVRYVLNAIRKFASDFQSISAHRIRPSRHMLLSGGTYENVGDHGQNTYQMLYAISELKGKELELVQNWLKHFGYSYHWKMSGKNQGEFLLKNLKTNVASNIVDNGFGISQSLPIILALSQLKKGTILLDSPEAFLQTKMQAELADMLIKGSQKGNLLVETGSEYLTIRIQRRIAEQKLSEKEVSFCFIYENEKGNSNIEQITISKYGMFEHASEEFLDFFSENYNDIVARDEARKKHLMEEKNYKCT